MSYLTVEVDIDHGKVVPREPERLPDTGKGLLTILTSASESASQKKKVDLPLIRGDGTNIVNPTSQDLDASLWD